MVKVLYVPAFAVFALLVWWVRRDSRPLEPRVFPVAPPLPSTERHGIVLDWRRAGVL